MLSYLKIENFVLIPSLSLDLSDGFTAITGETGAGKSILVDSLLFLFGSGSKNPVLDKGKTVRVCGQFEPPFDQELVKLLHQVDVSVNDPLVISRELPPTGRNRYFIQGRLLPRKAVGDLAPYLLSFHGQHRYQDLLRSPYQRHVLDALIANSALVEKVKGDYMAWREADRSHRQLLEKSGRRIHRHKELRSQVEEFEKLDFSESNYTDRSELLTQMREADRIRELTSALFGILEERQDSLLDLTGRSQRLLEELTSIQPRFGHYVECFKSFSSEAQQAVWDLRQMVERFSEQQINVDELELWFSRLQEIQRKYRLHRDEIENFLQTCREELESWEDFDTLVDRSEEKLKATRARFDSSADRLSGARLKAAEELKKRIEAACKRLAMPRAVWAVEWKKQEGDFGKETPIFLFSANPGVVPRPLDQVASGGELSRLMLAIKAAADADTGSLRTLVFDEVDAGVGGKVAIHVGELLAALGASAQVLNITHLPQVAAQASHHCRVLKHDRGSRVEIVLDDLDQQQRIEEIARMLSGTPASEIARSHARELLGLQQTSD